MFHRHWSSYDARCARSIFKTELPLRQMKVRNVLYNTVSRERKLVGPRSIAQARNFAAIGRQWRQLFLQLDATRRLISRSTIRKFIRSFLCLIAPVEHYRSPFGEESGRETGRRHDQPKATQFHIRFGKARGRFFSTGRRMHARLRGNPLLRRNLLLPPGRALFNRSVGGRGLGRVRATLISAGTLAYRFRRRVATRGAR